MTRDEAWQIWCEEVMPQKRNHTYVLEGAFYKAWCRAWQDALESKSDTSESEVKDMEAYNR